MARAEISKPKVDVVSDTGAVLVSLVLGEQLELPMTLDFIRDVTLPYTYKAVVVEGDAVVPPKKYPIAHRPGGIITELTVRLPIFRDIWDETLPYTTEDVVYYGGKYYKLVFGVNRVSVTPPDVDPEWTDTALNIVYVQFPKTLGANWTEVATAVKNLYGFFELRVNEPVGTLFPRTWKPIRGLIELLFSPVTISGS